MDRIHGTIEYDNAKIVLGPKEIAYFQNPSFSIQSLHSLSTNPGEVEQGILICEKGKYLGTVDDIRKKLIVPNKERCLEQRTKNLEWASEDLPSDPYEFTTLQDIKNTFRKLYAKEKYKRNILITSTKRKIPVKLRIQTKNWVNKFYKK